MDRIAALGLAGAGLLVLFVSIPVAVVALTAAAALFLVSLRESIGTPRHPDLSALLADLNLRGPGHHVPEQGRVRLFVPADARGPYLVPDLGEKAIQREPPGSLGIALDAPGASALAAWESMNGLPDGQGSEQAASHIQSALSRLGMADRVQVSKREGFLQIVMRVHDVGAAQQAQDSGWSRQGGCEASSLVCCLAALAWASPVRTDRSELEPDGTLTLELGACTTV